MKTIGILSENYQELYKHVQHLYSIKRYFDNLIFSNDKDFDYSRSLLQYFIDENAKLASSPGKIYTVESTITDIYKMNQDNGKVIPYETMSD